MIGFDQFRLNVGELPVFALLTSAPFGLRAIGLLIARQQVGLLFARQTSIATNVGFDLVSQLNQGRVGLISVIGGPDLEGLSPLSGRIKREAIA